MLNKRIASILVTSMVMVSMVGCSETVEIDINSRQEPIYKTSIKSEKSLSKDDYEFGVYVYNKYEKIRDEYNNQYFSDDWDNREEARNKTIYELRDLQVEIKEHKYANTEFSIELADDLIFMTNTAIQMCECGIDIDIASTEEWVLDVLNMLNRAIANNDFSEEYFDKLADEFNYQE